MILGDPPQTTGSGTNRFGQYARKVGSPLFKGILALRKELVPLVHCRYPGDRSGLVVENLIGDVGRNAKTSHSRHAGASQIVKAPPGDTGYCIELALRVAEVLKWMHPGSRKYEFAPILCFTQHGEGLIRQMHDVRLCVLCSQVGPISSYEGRSPPKRSATPLPGGGMPSAGD
jgi:hypothetical protein